MPSKKMFRKLAWFDKKNNKLISGKAKPLENVKGTKLFCHVPWQRLYIDNRGFVRPECQCPVDCSIGNIKEQSIAEMWNGEKMIEYRKRILSNGIKGFCNLDCLYRKIPESNLKYI